MRQSLFLIIIFSNAFLLFQIQPILTKQLLPQFGGGASIWSASLFFYQTLLLCGYWYAHKLSKLAIKRQLSVHAILLLLATAITFLPVTQELSSQLPPALQVTLALTLQIGLAFLLLSSCSVLLQQWHITTCNGAMPYHWYALSNLGSLLALLSYPFWVEVNLTLSAQKHYWYIGFIAVVVLKLVLMSRLATFEASKTVSPSCKQAPPVRVPAPQVKRVMLWLAFSITSSMLLLATTQMISTNIPPMPLIWILPLAIYLSSFIFCFSSATTYRRAHWLPFLIFAVIAGLMMFFTGSLFNSLTQLLMYCGILLICCVVCHGELRLSAPENGNLTTFYLIIALGGAIGSLFASLIAPVVFNGIDEFILALFLMLILFFISGNWRGLVQRAGVATLILGTLFSYIALETAFNRYTVAAERNFYGYIAVKDVTNGEIAERRLIDGTTVHGTQRLDSKTRFSGSYYQQDTGVAKAFRFLQQQESLNVAIIGLGAGVLADFNRDSDTMTFYELNPAVHQMAHDYFSYLSNAQGRVEVAIGDGRLALKQRHENDNPLLDALIIDAFSSDVIPGHLLTQEALALYWQNLHQDGLLIMHISNNHIDLMPVLQWHAQYFNKHLLKFSKTGRQHSDFGSEWVVLTSNRQFVHSNRHNTHKAPSEASAGTVQRWTDEQFSLLPLLKY